MTLQPTSLPEQNLSAGPPCPDLYDWAWLYSGQPVYIVLIALLGAALNVFVLLVFCLHKKARTVAEVYLSHLAAADLVLVSCLPFWAVNVSNGFDWPFGLFMCKAVNLGIKVNAYCTIYFLVLISMDRYVALVHTLSHGRMRRTKHAKLGCLLMWSFGVLLSVPTLVFRDLKSFPEYGVTACFLEYPNLTAALLFDVMLIVFSFVVPISIISFCTVKIIQALKVQVAGRLSAERSEQKASRLMLAVLLAFLVCWLPFHAVTILDVLSRAHVLRGCALESVLEICNQIFTYLAMFNSVLNPIVYVIVGKNFRKKVFEIFKEWNMKKTVTSESSRSSHLSSTLKTLA